MADNSSGTVLWITAGSDASREVLEPTAKGFGLNVRTASYEDALDALQAQRCDLVGVEIEGDPARGLSLLREIHTRIPRLTLFAVAAETGVATIRGAVEAGASEVLALPLSVRELTTALVKFNQKRGAGASSGLVGDVITICGARGGLGVTTLAVNLANRLAIETQTEVALVDLDLQRGDVGAFLNLNPTQSLATIAEAREDGEIDDVFLHNTLTRLKNGLHVLPAPPMIEDADSISDADVTLTLALLRTQFRYTVIDTPRTISATILPAFERADRLFVLTDLSVPGVRATQRLFELMTRLGIQAKRELLITEAFPAPVDMKDAVRTIGVEPTMIIPNDQAAAGKAMNNGVPLNGTRHTGLTVAMSELARITAGITQPARTRRGLLSRIFTKEAGKETPE